MTTLNFQDSVAVLEHDMPEDPPISIFDTAWQALDDEATLLSHMRSARPVHIDLVVDADECTPEKITALLDGHFEFNGESHTLTDPVDWLNNPSVDVEWHILLHKFYYAAGLGQAWLASGDARYAQRWATLIDGWMAVTPLGFIAPDVTGRRVQNWIYSTRAFLSHEAARDSHCVAPVDAGFLRRMLHSLHAQVEFLCQNLTAKRNHRTLELYAIFLAGVAFPEMKRAAYWRRFALQQTVANMQADLLPDGVHCELSTDYHHLALRNWLHVRNLAARHGEPVPPLMDALLERGLGFCLQLHKPDGVVPSLSDGDARGFLPLLAQGADLYGREDMRWVASRGTAGTPPAATLAHFADSGYSVLRSGWGTGAQDFAEPQYLVFDSGPLGEGNHGHFDCLSFELAAFGRSLVVDPGRYTYSEAGDINWRVHFRGTAAHNTVCVDGANQTRYEPKAVKGASRHASGAVRHRIVGGAPDAALLEGVQANGLSLLHGRAASQAYPVLHERCITFINREFWIVSDWLRAEEAHDYALLFQLGASAQDHSTLATAAHNPEAWRLDSPNLSILQPQHDAISATLHPGWVSQRYGHKLPAPGLRCSTRAANARFDSVLLPWRDAAPAAHLQEISLQHNQGGSRSALRIQLHEGAATRIHTWFHAQGESASHWTWDDWVFRGRWLHLCQAADGRLLKAHSHAGSCLARDGEPQPLCMAQGLHRGAAAP